MREFQWKDNFICQEKKIEHINKYTLLLLMLKIIPRNSDRIEENTKSLKVQDFSVYEDAYINNILPKSESLKPQSRLLHNQNIFKEIIDEMKKGAPLKINKQNKRILFQEFSKYVNLKDLKTQYTAFKFLIIGFFCLLITIPCFVKFPIDLWILLFINIVEILFSLLFYLLFKGRLKSFTLNCWRINQELCLVELQNEFSLLESELKISIDPYKEFTFNTAYEQFKNMFDVPSNFIEICKAKKIIDENNIVNSKYNHFLIQYLKSIRNEKYKNENFDWQLIKHVLIFDITKNRKSDFLKENFKEDSPEGKRYLEFIKLFK